MGKKLALFGILVVFFGGLLYLIFGSTPFRVIKAVFTSKQEKHNPLLVRTWIRNKMELIDTNFIILNKNGTYSQKVKTFISEVNSSGRWHGDDKELVLMEQSRKNSLESEPEVSQPPLMTYYYNILQLDSNQLVLLMDLEKSSSFPREMGVIKTDTLYLKPL